MSICQGWVDRLEDAYLEQYNEDNAIAISKYFRNQFESFGLKNGLRRSIAKPFLEELKKENADDLFEIMKLLWAKPQREFQHTGMEVLMKYRKKFNDKLVEPLEFIITHKSWWDTVDFIAAHIVGWAYLNGFINRNKIMQWNASDHLWLIRSSLIFQLKYKDELDWPLLQQLIEPKFYHSDFFIRKAIGWALRQYSYSRPERVLEYLDTHEMSNLSRREAMKGLVRKGYSTDKYQ